MKLDLLVDSTYESINSWVTNKAAEWGEKPNLLFYLSVAPQLAPGIAQKLSDHKLC
jgi:glucose-6-phosphate 1-dehydrogenase